MKSPTLVVSGESKNVHFKDDNYNSGRLYADRPGGGVLVDLHLADKGYRGSTAVRCKLSDEMAALLHKALGLLLDANGHDKALDAPSDSPPCAGCGYASNGEPSARGACQRCFFPRWSMFWPVVEPAPDAT